jgi:cell wall-associated NlpC family hydrolase
MRGVMRRLAASFVASLACLAPAATAHAATLAGWDRAEQGTVARAGVLPKLRDGFHGADTLSAGQLAHALSAIARRTGAHPVAVPGGASITVASFHRYVVRQLGLADLARSVQGEAADAGLQPPSRFGSEVVARQLGLRFDHPSRDDRLELYPTDPITRAEAAYSFAQILRNPTGGPYYAREVFGRFSLPAYTDAQRRVLRIAVSKIGMPYVWGGESDTTSSRYGPQAHGGYDCSGFVWRVFKLSGDPAGAQIGGRTAAAMAREIPKRQRIGFKRIKPADLLFFYPPGIGHVGIAMSRDFMIHSSSQGVYVAPLFESWRSGAFAWARRVL